MNIMFKAKINVSGFMDFGYLFNLCVYPKEYRYCVVLKTFISSTKSFYFFKLKGINWL